MEEGRQRLINESLKESIQPIKEAQKNIRPQRGSVNPQILTQSMLSEDLSSFKKIKRRYKILAGVSICCAIFGLVVMLAIPPYIATQLKQTAIDQALWRPDNQGLWAHFPGDSNTQICRNYTFFNFTNSRDVLLYNSKPVFKQIQGFKIYERQDFVNITYNEDGTLVTVKDWLHFDPNPESRNMKEKVQILNVGKIGYWFQLKNARPALLLQQGMATFFDSLEKEVSNNILGQGISSQYLNSQSVFTNSVLKSLQFTDQNADFIWNDKAYGLGNPNTIDFWVQATLDSSKSQYSPDALLLKDYFTLSDMQLGGILAVLTQYINSIQGLILDNHYCDDGFICTGRNLAVNQLASQYVTMETPPVSTTSPTQTICDSNSTCDGKFPELASFYRNVYLQEHPSQNKSLTFDQKSVLSWFNHNISKQGNTKPNCLLHIGNLDILWENGLNYDIKKDIKFIENIKERFDLQSNDHAKVFWSWIKYFKEEMVTQGGKNQQVGISTLFTSSLYQSFIKVQNKLQMFLLNEIILENTKFKSCSTLFANTFQIQNTSIINQLCDKYQNKRQIYIDALIKACKNKFAEEWKEFNKIVGYIGMESMCDPTISDGQGFGRYYDEARKKLDTYYQCNQTPNQYCSDYQLAAKQWANSTISRNPIPQISQKYLPSASISDWFPELTEPFQYFYYTSLYPEKKFKQITTKQAYNYLNFDSFFSSSVVLKLMLKSTVSQDLINYFRYVTIFVAMDGFTMERTAQQIIFGYTDQLLEEIRLAYPPFGGDPSTPSFIAFNEPNIKENQTTLVLEMATGTGNYPDIGQYKKINGFDYLTINKTSFNGTSVNSQLVSPWIGNDFFYGTNAKFFSPNQFEINNLSLYIPNLQRYGSGNETFEYQRFGFDLRIGYIGRSILQSTESSDDNAKYYQSYYSVFNETSVLGLPLYITKNHFMNCTSNWSSFVDIYDETGTNKYVETSHWDDTFIIVQPYSGVSFQSTIFLQTNYLYEPDSLFTYNQTFFLPIFSVYRSGNLTQETAQHYFGLLKTAKSAINWTFYIGLVVMIVFLLIVMFAIFKLCTFKKSHKMRDEGFPENKKNELGISLQKPIRDQSWKRQDWRREIEEEQQKQKKQEQ